MQDLGTLGGAGSTAVANNLANIAGAADIQDTSAFHAFIHSEQGVTAAGTLGGNQSSALGYNTPGHAVGFSTIADGSVHAFLYTDAKMFDLNSLCDLATSNFQVLTAAKAINDSMVIVGEGITAAGEKHAFMLTPLAVDGGRWSYLWCGAYESYGRGGEWVWIQIDGWWWWESGCGCYRWHGAPGEETLCPPQPPHCWWYPLPCPPNCKRPPEDGNPPEPRTPPLDGYIQKIPKDKVPKDKIPKDKIPKDKHLKDNEPDDPVPPSEEDKDQPQLHIDKNGRPPKYNIPNEKDPAPPPKEPDDHKLPPAVVKVPPIRRDPPTGITPPPIRKKSTPTPTPTPLVLPGVK